MEQEEHKLIIDYRNGTIEARCSCGGWDMTLASIRIPKLRAVYDRIEGEHYRHVEEAESHELAPT